MKGSILFSGLG